jgi:hypothetical protein
MRRGAWTILLTAVTSGATLCVAKPAGAYEAEVEATTAAQYYTLASPYGEPVVRRRRYTQTLALGVYDIQGERERPLDPSLSFKARLRLDADLGVERPEYSPHRRDRFVPGLQEAPVDLMYAYLDGRGYFDGLLGFRIGRQYVTDVLGWWSFDGALVRMTTPAFFDVEAYAGFEQRGGLPMLASSRFEADGVWRGDRGELEVEQFPSFLSEEALAPAYAFAFSSTGLSWLDTRLTYRKVVNRDTVYISPFASLDGGYDVVGGDRVSTEKAGYALNLSEPSLGAVGGDVVYDLYNQVVSEYAASLDWYMTDQITLGADYEYFLPTFDGDSIFNWFAHEGMTTAVGRARWVLSRRFDAGVSSGVKIFQTQGDPESYGEGRTFDGPPPSREQRLLLDHVGDAAMRYRWPSGSVRVHGLVESGQRGHRVGGDTTLVQRLGGGFYDTLAVLSLYDWEDSLRPTRDATSFTYVLGGGINPFERTRLGLEWEHSMNRLVGQRYRALATLELSVFP